MAKAVTSVWGEEFFQFLAALTILPRTILKNRMNSSFSFKSSWCNWINSSPKLQRRHLPFLLSLSFFYATLRWRVVPENVPGADSGLCSVYIAKMHTFTFCKENLYYTPCVLATVDVMYTMDAPHPGYSNSVPWAALALSLLTPWAD